MLMDEYRKGWALRYLREAMDEIKIAKRNSEAFDLALDALRKAQMAVYYSLGEPSFIERIVEEALEGMLPLENPILKCLVEIERTIKILEDMPNNQKSNAIIVKESDRIISVASKIVDLLISED
jgi:hypothetical protein